MVYTIVKDYWYTFLRYGYRVWNVFLIEFYLVIGLTVLLFQIMEIFFNILVKMHWNTNCYSKICIIVFVLGTFFCVIWNSLDFRKRNVLCNDFLTVLFCLILFYKSLVYSLYLFQNRSYMFLVNFELLIPFFILLPIFWVCMWSDFYVTIFYSYTFLWVVVHNNPFTFNFLFWLLWFTNVQTLYCPMK